ncbi:hypothetical protein [Microbulbifer litoralis]|uniref:hypothetical protein n=1 Tax=Microbulbifer litoralis TaxID=2933965 RepID=UPI0020298D57|nr:hypothetical protein [Microbulbifer sp. GX H0434]
MPDLDPKIIEQLQRPVFIPPDDLVISIYKECTPRILLVSDGLTFDSASFGLSTFVNTLRTGTIHGMTPIVKTALTGNGDADYESFTFTESSLSINKYDVLFLFAYDSFGTLPVAERTVIEKFMNDGGGVFATGDHATLGLRLCGDIARVRGMRKWNGPSASSPSRLSTNDPGVDNQFQFSDQSDAIPQKIYPAYSGDEIESAPHYLLQHPTKRVIEVLPDHPHESECVLPDNLNDESEWPRDGEGDVVSPEIVALSVTYGGGFQGPNKQPISEPRAFGAIGAYDGHRAGVGRISVDATWHHFININLGEDGTRLSANADAYERVNQYFRNIATWLMPRRVRRCLRWPVITTLRDYYPVREFLPELAEGKLTLEKAIDAGVELESTLSQFLTAGDRKELVEDLVELAGSRLNEFSLPEKEQSRVNRIFMRSMLPGPLVRQAAWGALAHAVATAFPHSSDLQARFKEIGGVEGLDKHLQASLSESFEQLKEAVVAGRKGVDLYLEYL